MFSTDKFQDFEIREFDILDSTQEEAKRIIKARFQTSILPDNIVILAHQQTSGKGRGAKEWISDEGNLFFSLIIDSKRISPSEITPYIAAISVHSIIHKLLPDNSVTTKWPNDILINGRKACGILIERFGDYIIIGIGINMSSSPKYLDSGRKACSLNEFTKYIDPKRLLHLILSRFHENIIEYGTAGFDNIRTLYKQHLYKLNEQVELDYLGKKIIGTIHDISPEGDLVIETENGLQEYRVGEIFDI